MDLTIEINEQIDNDENSSFEILMNINNTFVIIYDIGYLIFVKYISNNFFYYSNILMMSLKHYGNFYKHKKTDDVLKDIKIQNETKNSEFHFEFYKINTKIDNLEKSNVKTNAKIDNLEKSFVHLEKSFVHLEKSNVEMKQTLQQILQVLQNKN